MNCSRCDSPRTLSINCLPIEIPDDDPHFDKFEADGVTRKCLAFTRSMVGQLTLGYRNQINQLTSFADASQIYGSTECDANKLRLFQQGALWLLDVRPLGTCVAGKLNFTDQWGSLRNLLPQGTQEPQCRSAAAGLSCFVAGDTRNNEHPGMAVIHTVWMREHNRIAEALHRLNNRWNDERIFQACLCSLFYLLTPTPLRRRRAASSSPSTSTSSSTSSRPR